jgi:hypothetical protein
MADIKNLCIPCKMTGLAMQIVLALPTPKGRGPALPGWADEKAMGLVPLTDYQYTLRAPRRGFVYVFHKKCATGDNRWYGWTVSGDGRLYPMGDLDFVAMQDLGQCGTIGHNNARLHCLILEKPHLCSTSWIMFIEQQLSKKARQRYADEDTLRNERMLKFEPAQLIESSAPSSTCITAGSEAALQQVADYSPQFLPNSLSMGLPYDVPSSVIKTISTKEDGSFDEKTLQKHHSTQFPWGDYLYTHSPEPKTKRNAALGAQMLKERTKKADGTEHPGVLVALPDALGCAQEMNGYTHDVAGCIKRYGEERELQITAYNAISGIKIALTQSVQKHMVESQRIIMSAAQFQTLMAVQPNPRGWPQDVRHEYLTSYVDTSTYGVRMVEVFPPGHEEKKLKAIHQGTINAVDSQWPKYEAKIDWPALNTFKTNWDNLLTKASDEQDKRTKELIKWLEAPALQQAFNDYHPEDAADGVAFESVVGQALMGMTGSASGNQKINAWVKEGQAKPSNLLWRAFALNRTETMQALDAVLADAKQHAGTPLTETAVLAAQGSTKHLAKFADLIKKSLTLHNTLRKDGVTHVRTGGLEKIFMTVGERFFQPFMKKGLDTVGEWGVKGLLLVRSGADYTHTMSLILAEAKFGKAGRTETLLALSMGKALADSKTSAGFKELKEAWTKLVSDADTPKTNSNPKLAGGYNEARDLRFAMAATMLQAVFAWKLSQDAAKDPNNKKIQGELFAAELSLGAGVIDLGATVIKGLAKTGDKALSFQALKIGGGVLSASAGIFAGTNDWNDAGKSKENSQKVLAYLYGSKAIANFAGASFSGLATLSYANPVAEMLALRFPSSMLARGVGKVFGRLFAYRAILMLGGLGFNVVVIAIQGSVWYFSDNALERWCEESAFGKAEKSHRISNAENQMRHFADALQEVI